jgi:hypothetical protein
MTSRFEKTFQSRPILVDKEDITTLCDVIPLLSIGLKLNTEAQRQAWDYLHCVGFYHLIILWLVLLVRRRPSNSIQTLFNKNTKALAYQ